MTLAAQDFCRWFHGSQMRLAGESTVRDISDTEVQERIEGFVDGYLKEYNRMERWEKPYDLRELPFPLQRALVERWEKLHLDWLCDNPEYEYSVAGGFTKTGDEA